MSYFDGIKVGDKIWTIHEGWTTVRELCETEGYPIETVRDVTYTMDGKRYTDDAHQSAFWSDPSIVAPPRPKKLVKKMIEVRPYYDTLHKVYGIACNLLNLESNPIIEGSQDDYFPWCGPVQTIEVEVEE